jgi:hypothetical protein
MIGCYAVAATTMLQINIVIARHSGGTASSNTYGPDSGSSPACRSCRQGTLNAGRSRARSGATVGANTYRADSGSSPACRSCRPGTNLTAWSQLGRNGRSAGSKPYCLDSGSCSAANRSCRPGTQASGSVRPRSGGFARSKAYCPDSGSCSAANRSCRPDRLRIAVFRAPASRPDTFACRSHWGAPDGHPCRLKAHCLPNNSVSQEFACRRHTFAGRPNRRAPVGRPCRTHWAERVPGMSAPQVFASRPDMFACKSRRRAPVDHPCKPVGRAEWHPGKLVPQVFASRPDMFACKSRRPAPVDHPCSSRPQGSHRIGKSAMIRKKTIPLQRTCSCQPLRSAPLNELHRRGERQSFAPIWKYNDKIRWLAGRRQLQGCCIDPWRSCWQIGLRESTFEASLAAAPT